jgi:ribosomal protein L23
MSQKFLDLLDVEEVKTLILDEIKKLALDGYTSNLNKSIVLATEGESSESLLQLSDKIDQISKVIDIYQDELEKLHSL